jgi:hypothetical protein
VQGLDFMARPLYIHTSSRQRESYVRTITASVPLENEITGRESQGACHQDELIGGIPPVVK